MPQSNSSAPQVALLAPVPLEHLLDGRVVASEQGKVAFGSRAWQLFRQLDDLRQGQPVDVYLYASHAGNPAEQGISWFGRYIGHVDSLNGSHPDKMRFRPSSTARYSSDNEGHWAIFWEVEDLRELEPEERPRITDFTGYGKKKRYVRNFVPEGPTLVQHP